MAGAKQSELLRESLERQFFPHLISLGFVRDDRQQPKIVCFRRKTETAVQTVALLYGGSRSQKGFWVQFTEAPLEGIDYWGSHLSADDIFPGNFALLRGWLIPKRGMRWFHSEQSLWNRLFSKEQDQARQMVEKLLCLFPEVVGWWNDKTKREHLIILPPVPPRPIPDHAPVHGIPIKPSILQKFFAYDFVWVVGFFGIAVSISLFFALTAFPSWSLMYGNIVPGAMIGLLASIVTIKTLWRIRVWLNGGRFCKGDLVQVLAGPHFGKIAAVYEEWPSRNQVRVDLGKLERKEVKDVFSYVQLCRVKKNEPCNAPTKHRH